MRHRKSLFLFIEAVALGGPTSLLLICGLLYIVGGSVYQLAEGRPLSAIGALAVAWALLQFWIPAACTISQHPYKFGAEFGLGILGAFIGIVVMNAGMPDWFSAALVGLPC
ncbi:hypothetical protein J2X56_004564 [Herbaspirillum sp. 1173]|uniref:hypothetical protein n=1 Tax=Herbaspirillum sp. 1173 TaxID=2817734 RepID=UPI00285E41B0|nr:hypothetical protein [Herbaspirillum sp. 1173]MDR6742533.1 hypothetical protein [Herbaspirillum sp. 1173]